MLKETVYNNNGVDESPILNNTSLVLTSYEGLTSQQKQRVDYLHGLIGDHAIGLVQCIESRGKNSWASVFEKVMRLTEASRDDRKYYDALYENIIVAQEYTFSQITGLVAEVRRDLRLTPYLLNMRKDCESDLFDLFITKEIWHSEESVTAAPKRKLIGYKPVFRIKPEELI